jgi:hypothetical protein
MTKPNHLAGKLHRERNHAQILKMRAQNFGYDEIAQRLGVSRGMVAGVLHRHRKAEGTAKEGVGRPKKITPLKVAKTRRGKFPFLPSTPRKPPRQIDLQAMKDEPVPLGDRPGGCLWLHGDATDRLFCGHDRVEGSSWCAHHRRRVMVPTPKPAPKAEKIAIKYRRR